MQVQTGTQYWYARNNNRQGPITGAALIELARQGGLAPTDLVWCDGMPEWAPASSLAGLFGPPPMAVPAVPPPPGSPPMMPPVPGAAVVTRAIYPRAPLKRTSFGLWLGLSLASLLPLIIGIVLIVIGNEEYEDGLIAAGAAVTVLGAILLISGYVVGMMNVFRAWAGIQGLPGVTASPGLAIGLLFVPLVNIVWIFFAFWKWSQDFNKFVQRNGITSVQKAPEGLFLATCILCVVGVVPIIGGIVSLANVVIFPMCMWNMCTAANSLKAHCESLPA